MVIAEYRSRPEPSRHGGPEPATRGGGDPDGTTFTDAASNVSAVCADPAAELITATAAIAFHLRIRTFCVCDDPISKNVQ
jgi:hypothetical protein